METALVFAMLIGGLGSVYSYFLYPLLLLLLPDRRPNTESGLTLGGQDTPAFPPTVTVIVACFNEESQLSEKLEDTLANGYPPELMSILVASDQSTDRTHEIAKEYCGHGVRLVVSPERLGKEHAQGIALKTANSDVIIFTDAGARLNFGAIHQIVKRLSEPEIGAVSSEDDVRSADGTPAGEGLYQRYEMWLRGIEARKSTLIGLTGALFAARRESCEPWDATVDSDFNTALNCIRSGFVAVTDNNVRCIYQDLGNDREEYKRKVRTVLRGICCLSRHAEMLNPVRRPMIAWQLFSHKIGRYLVPWSMLLVATSSSMLAIYAEEAWIRVWLVPIVGVQIVFFGLATLGFLVPQARRLRLVRVISFFMLANIAVAHASVLFTMGRRIRVWNPSQRAAMTVGRQ